MVNRIVYLDTAKFICIFFMVVGHWTSNEIILLYIYSFHMPALFIISGMLYKPRLWYKTILSFGIPVVFYSIINLFVLIALREISIGQLPTKEMFFRFFHYRYGLGEGLFMGDWFLWALLGLRLIFGDIHFFGFLRKYYVPISFCAIAYMSFESYLVSIDTLYRGMYFGRMIPSMAFFCLGLFLKDCNWQPQNMNHYVVILLGCAFIIFPIFNGYGSLNSNCYGVSYLVYFINASLSTFFLFAVLNYIPSMKFVTTISKGTLLILGMHIPIMKILNLICPTFFYELLPIVVLLICYFPIIYLEKWCPILLGKLR